MFGNLEFNKYWFKNWYDDTKYGYDNWGTIQEMSKISKKVTKILTPKIGNIMVLAI